MGDNGDPKLSNEGQEQKLLATVKIEGEEHKILNSVTVIEIVVHKLDNDKELSQVIAHEFMMTDHKTYMLRLLTDAIMTVARARKRKPMIKLATEAMFNRLRRGSRKGAFGKGG